MVRTLNPNNAKRRQERADRKAALRSAATDGATYAELPVLRRLSKRSPDPAPDPPADRLRRRKKPVQASGPGYVPPAGTPRLVALWVRLVQRVSAMPARSYSGVRKIVDNLHFDVSGASFFGSGHDGIGVRFEGLCFTDRGKMGQLMRNYFDPNEWKKAVDKVESRAGKPHTSVAVRLTATGKDSRSQGFCMQSLILSMTKDCNTIDIFYRSTEVTQKFCADLIFFSRVIPEYLLKPLGMDAGDIQTVRFHFANAYISSVFLPTALRFAEGGAVAYLESFRKKDERFWRTSCMVAARYMRTVNVYNYMTQKKQYLAMHIPEMVEQRAELKPYLKEHIDRISAEQGAHMFADTDADGDDE